MRSSTDAFLHNLRVREASDSQTYAQLPSGARHVSEKTTQKEEDLCRVPGRRKNIYFSLETGMDVLRHIIASRQNLGHRSTITLSG